jgi:hypothetical protein
MNYLLLVITLFSANLWSAEITCPSEITTVAELDECLIKNNKKPTKNQQEIQNWKKKLNISASLEIEVQKVKTIAEVKCPPHATQQVVAEKLALEIENILKSGSLQIKEWKVPDFPETGAKDYGMLKSQGCNPKDLLLRMKSDVANTPPDLMNVYNMGLAIDTTQSQENNLQILAASLDAIYSSIPENGNMAFSVTAYGDEFRGGLKFEGSKSYVLPRVKEFILSQRIYGGGTPPEFVYGGSYITSKNLGRQHGLIFNWTNAPNDNTKAQTRSGSIAYSLRHLDGFAQSNVHIIRNVFLKCH